RVVEQPKETPPASGSGVPRSSHLQNTGAAHPADMNTKTAALSTPASKPEVTNTIGFVTGGGHTLLEKARQAKLKGYEGDPCRECGQFTMVRNGTCLKCDTCGTTSGCS